MTVCTRLTFLGPRKVLPLPNRPISTPTFSVEGGRNFPLHLRRAQRCSHAQHWPPRWPASAVADYGGREQGHGRVLPSSSFTAKVHSNQRCCYGRQQPMGETSRRPL